MQDPLDGLDFHIEAVPCEVIRQPWLHTAKTLGGETYPAPFPDVPVGPEKCPHPAKTIVKWRVCPCIATFKTWVEMNPILAETKSPEMCWGLCVISTAMCDSHIEYFVDYLTYPFVCPRCNVGFSSPREILLDGVDINEG